MSCPEIINPNRPQRHVDLSRYALLHPEGRQLISGWFQRAWGERNCQQDEAFEPFIFGWFAFNGWAACITDTDRDRDIIVALAADQIINNDFLHAIQNNQSVSASVETFATLLPIFDVKSLRRRGILRDIIESRQERIAYYLSHGANQIEPKSKDRGQPLTWDITK